MPSMLKFESYDPVCHEHLEFYSFKVIKNLLERCRLRVIDVQMNAINGGSFAVTACKKNAPYRSNHPVIEWMLWQEDRYEEDRYAKAIPEFRRKGIPSPERCLELIEALISDGKIIFGYGALRRAMFFYQFCGLTSKHIPYIADVNKDNSGVLPQGRIYRLLRMRHVP